jgi:hypothetical protein
LPRSTIVWSAGDSQKRRCWPDEPWGRKPCLRCEPLPSLTPIRGERTASRAHRLTNALGRSLNSAHRANYRLGLALSPVERRTTHYGDCGPCCLCRAVRYSFRRLALRVRYRKTGRQDSRSRRPHRGRRRTGDVAEAANSTSSSSVVTCKMWGSVSCSCGSGILTGPRLVVHPL